MDKCLCLVPVPDEAGEYCVECHKDIELPDLGDIVGICNLCDETAADCSKTPSDLKRFHKLFRSHKKAKALGYRGDLLRWIEFVQER
jgi:hypothetical protein